MTTDGHNSSSFEHHHLDQVFDAFRLSTKERILVMSLLERGVQRASTVARYCALPRNTVRGLLDKLVGDGILVRTRHGNTHYYAVEQINRLESQLKEKRAVVLEEISRQLDALKKAGTAFANQSLASKRPRVTFYEGEDGLRRVYEDTLLSSEGIRSWGSFDSNREMIPNYFPKYYKRRAKKGIHLTLIHPDSPLARTAILEDKKELRTSVLVPHEVLDLTPEIQVYDDKVNIVSGRDKLGIIIESREISDALKSIFDLSFKGANALYAKLNEKTRLKDKKRRVRSKYK